MTNEELIKEFSRWLNNGKGDVWYREEEWSSWGLISVAWDNKDAQYITNDKHAELRKLQIDEPDTKFEFFGVKDSWVEAKPQWSVELEYRVKEPVYEWQWVYYQTLMNTWRLTDKHYVEAESTAWIKFEKSKRIKKC